MPVTRFAIAIYLGIRFILQVWIPRGSITIKRCRVILGVLWLPLVSIIYIDHIITDMLYWYPGSWAIRPMPVVFFLVWIVFVVVDVLYQYRVIIKLKENGAPGEI